MKVVIFCGGQGLRLREYSENVPKPLVPIGDAPVMWHLMKYYAHYGRKEYNPGPEATSEHPAASMTVRPPAPPVRPRSMQKVVAPVQHRFATSDGPTLPMRNARGMANR